MRAWARRLASLTVPEIRIAYLRNQLSNRPDDQAAQLIACTLRGAQNRDSELMALLPWLSLALADPGCRPLREAVARWLLGQQEDDLAAALCEPDPPSDSEVEPPTRMAGWRREEALSLGERKARARRVDRTHIMHSLRDPHPDVIEILLGNPALTAGDVVRLCAGERLSSEVSRRVFRKARWIVRYPVKVALVLNPNTPLDIRLQLAPLLRRRDLQRVLASPRGLSPALAEACRRMLKPAAFH